MPKDPDFELIRRCQTETGRAREAAFAELFETYKDRVFNLAGRVLGNPADAEDVSQEAFVTVFRKIREFRFSSRFYTWLYRIVFNLCVDQRRKGAASALPAISSTEGESILAGLSDPDPGPAERVGEGESRRRTVERALRRLSDPLRAVVVLRYMEDLAYEEIADVLGISLGTVKSRLSRAHHSLQEMFGGPRGTREGEGKERIAHERDA
jgi:RNA polymerase sigma-70 factor (ECF subfamily)